ncbi:MAG: ribonuclease R [Alistipes sp.]
MIRKNETQTTERQKPVKSFDRKTLITNIFREFPEKKFSLKHLASSTGGATKEGRRETGTAVEELTAEGLIEECGFEKFRLTPRNIPHMTGVVDMISTGSLYVRVEGQEKDIFVNQRNSLNALDGDTVDLVLTLKGRNGSPEGEVIRIVERNKKRYVGVAEVGENQIFVRCDSRRMPMDIYLSKRQYPDLKDGEKVVIRIADWAMGSKSPSGELIEVLGVAGDNDTEMHAILAEYDLPYHFEAEVEQAAHAMQSQITKQDYAERRDFRDVTTFTVDPADAKDFDDALSVRKVKEGVWEIGVHIADVTHYVRPQSIIDTEAEARGTSVYLVDRTVPMLPERLSNELCSLRPDEESLCFSAVFTINEGLELLDEWFGRTVIHSNRRFTYAEAQEIIEGAHGDYEEEVLTLNRLAQALRAQRFKNGAISFDRDEAKFILDEKGKPLGVYFKEQKESNQMIEEFMLLANRRVAEFCSHSTKSGKKLTRTMVYRVHDTPSEEKLDKFRTFILRFGHIFKAAKGPAIAKELNQLLAEVKGSSQENVISTMAVRSMAKAYYTTDNIGHYGLAFPFYTHFTSPIRRYPDMMVHRLLARYLDEQKSADKETFENLCAHASDREIVAAEAERASIKYKMVEFMKERIGEEFDGHISGLTEWGMYVELDATHIEGMTFLRDIEGDFFQFDEERYEIFGHRTGRHFTLGDAVRIRVRRADLQKRQLDFELLLDESGGTEETVTEKIAREARRENDARNERGRRGKSGGAKSTGSARRGSSKGAPAAKSTHTNHRHK